MRPELFIVTLLGAIVAALAHPPNDSPLFNLMEPHLSECAGKLSAESVKLMKENHETDNAEIRCFHACLMTKSGLMNGAKLDIPKIEKIMTESDNSEMGKKLIDAIKGCQAESEVSGDACEVSGNYNKCIKAKLLK